MTALKKPDSKPYDPYTLDNDPIDDGVGVSYEEGRVDRHLDVSYPGLIDFVSRPGLREKMDLILAKRREQLNGDRLV